MGIIAHSGQIWYNAGSILRREADMPQQALAIFDFDGTMLSGDSIIRYIAYAMKRGYEPWYKLPARLLQGLIAVCGLMPAQKGKSLALSFLSRMAQQERENFNRDFCRLHLLPRLYPKAVQRMRRHREEGCRVLLVSASPDIYLRPLQGDLPIDALLASPTDKDGRVSSSTRGQEKVRRVKDWAARQPFEIDWEHSFAYGNSANDLPVMRLCGHPVCINPSRKMKKRAKDLPIEYWKKQ